MHIHQKQMLVIKCWEQMQGAQMLKRCRRFFIVLLKTVVRILWLTLLYIWGFAVRMACIASCFKRNRDTGNSERCCNCEQVQMDLAKTRSKEDELTKELKDLRAYIKEISVKYANLDEDSKKLTKQMAEVLEKGGNLENVSDEHSNMKLGRRFEAINSKQWVIVSDWLAENTEMAEIERISFLKTLMQKAYTRCEELADRPLRDFLFLDEHSSLPSPKENPEIYKIRRINGQTKSTRQKIKQKIIEYVLNEDKDTTGILKQEEAKEKLRGFLEDFADCCWLMIISHPRLVVRFDVIGLPFEGQLKERYKQFSCQDTVIDKKMKKGCIKEVVWPCVELDDGSGFFKKGEVITVEEGIEDEETKEKNEKKGAEKEKGLNN